MLICRLKKLGEEFYEHVDSVEVADMLDVDFDTVDHLYNYWVLKRKVSRLCVVGVHLLAT